MSTHVMDDQRSGLLALDPDLPVVAARAALQLDSVIAAARRGAKIDTARTDAIDDLARMMTQISTAIAGETGDFTSRSLMDPLTANIVSRAYTDASRKELKSLGELRVAADQLSGMFKKASGPQENSGKDPLEPLALLRDFCVKLSEYAASKKLLAYGERPVPQYWRAW
jgi:hypothetical protein